MSMPSSAQSSPHINASDSLSIKLRMMQKMTPSISTREYIRWVPERPSEPTTTITLTSAESRFVDLRIYKPTQNGGCSHDQEDVLPSNRVQWAVGGASSTKLRTAPDGHRVPHSVWKHWVDVHSEEPEKITDEGDMIPQPDGEHTLEQGSMINPSTGKLTEYEEWWREVKVDVVPGGNGSSGSDGERLRTCVVLMLHDDDHKARGMVVRLGQYCQGVVKVRKDWALERWEWKAAKTNEASSSVAKDENGWKRTVRVGDRWLPCGAALREDLLKVGGEVKHQEMVWKVMELDHF